MDEWVEVVGFTSYEINRRGEVRNKSTGRVLIPCVYKGKYMSVLLKSDDGVYKRRNVSKLVAEIFLPKPKHRRCECVIHVDGSVSNNDVTNLRWASIGEATGNNQKVMCRETGEIFDSISDCARSMGLGRRTVSNNLNRATRNTRSGYYFDYVD